MANCFLPAEILLPPAGTPLDPWACIAVDQFTSEPAYWQRAEARAAHQPSTLHIVLPEAYLVRRKNRRAWPRSARPCRHITKAC